MKLTENSPGVINGTQGPQKNLVVLPQIATETHFHVQHGIKTTLVFLTAEGEASWLLLPSFISLLSGGTVKSESIYSCILKVIGQV